ncbi:MAG: hypothetical protein ACREK4_00080 [Candidatus Rokuibacteriota bacterium]
MRQCEAFLAAADAEERERLAGLLTITSVGTRGGQDAIRRLHRELRREI